MNADKNMSSELRRMLKEKDFLRVIEASNGFEALVAKRAQLCEDDGNIKEFDALWLGSFSHAAFKGVPDNGTMPFVDKLMTIKEITAVANKPLIVDVDMINEIGQLATNISIYESGGAAGVVIEDKKGVKYNSLYGTRRPQQLETPEWFAKKLYCIKNMVHNKDFMVFARTETLIAGGTVAEALERAKVYVEAGADGMVIHSICHDGRDVFEFAEAFKSRYPDVPLVFIPTMYNHFKDTELSQKGADIIIYANHLMRSAYAAMKKTAMSILRDGRTLYADEEYCATIESVLRLISGEEDD